MNKEDRIIELLERILEEVSSIQTNTSWNDNHLNDIKSGVENIEKQLKKEN
ncbi:hypothetical protein [Clostridium weizhouense]|uniref:Uncharacterized protein n=1 Tax=Clostridium weizhouense TaxID=2859781 RepID=A0ABS7AQL6_9CLOT|nr:hypothetical protein [Clostridium weizhouense]MBW6410972.1 hypothetical protein [Clostridium weizhouense]